MQRWGHTVPWFISFASRDLPGAQEKTWELCRGCNFDTNREIRYTVGTLVRIKWRTELASLGKSETFTGSTERIFHFSELWHRAGSKRDRQRNQHRWPKE